MKVNKISLDLQEIEKFQKPKGDHFIKVKLRFLALGSFEFCVLYKITNYKLQLQLQLQKSLNFVFFTKVP